jgi:hypothetical protein
MQVNRTHNAPNTLNMLFPPTGEQAHAGQSGQAVPVAPLARGPAKADPAAKPHTPAPPAAGVVLKLSTPTEEKPEKSIYSKGSLFGAPKIDLGSMTLQSQLALGRDKGVFTKITLSQDGVLRVNPDVPQNPNSPVFVASAVTAMRDFQEGIALLKEQTPEGKQSAGFFADGLRSLAQAAAKFKVFA